MTTRERRQARAERLREWADKRQHDASLTFAAHEKYRGDHAFNTQPGHIPERARVIDREDRAFASLAKADSMSSRAASIEAQIDRSIYSDDPDAVEALTARVAELEAKRDHMKKVNAAYRKRDDAALTALGSMSSDAWDKALAGGWSKKPYASYEFQNIGGNIKRNRDRIADVQRRTERAAAAEAKGGVSIDGAGDYVSVTFSEKPDREVINAMKAAGFHWSGGSWHGKRDELPEAVKGA